MLRCNRGHFGLRFTGGFGHLFLQQIDLRFSFALDLTRVIANYLIDCQSKAIREILSVAPSAFGYGVTLSHDDRTIYFSLVTTEADIWLATLN